MRPETSGALLIAAALLLGGCAWLPENAMGSWFEPDTTPIQVTELRRGFYCNTPGSAARVSLLADAAAVRAWEQARGTTLVGDDSLPAGPYALVEMGQRSSGGYAIAVSRSAALRNATAVLNATFITPPPGRLTTQALSQPCVLVGLPEGRYRDVEVRDQDGVIRASTDAAVVQPPTEEPGPAE